MNFAEAAANLLTIDPLEPQAKIPESKACAVNVMIARKGELSQIRDDSAGAQIAAPEESGK